MPESAPTDDDRERRLIEAVVALAKTFREEREQLLLRLTQLEHEIEMLALRLDEQTRPRRAGPRAAPPPGPSQTPS
jgi:hypothetical protein